MIFMINTDHKKHTNLCSIFMGDKFYQQMTNDQPVRANLLIAPFIPHFAHSTFFCNNRGPILRNFVYYVY